MDTDPPIPPVAPGPSTPLPGPSVPSIAADALYHLLGGRHCPLIVDARNAGAFEGDDSMLPGAMRVPPEKIVGWSASTHTKAIVVYCLRGHEVSQNAAKVLLARGYRARFLEGGIELWREIGLPVMRKSMQFGIPGDRATRWITRERPKIDRIACPWLVKRFIDPRAEFLYVPTDEVFAAAKTRQAIAYDIPGAPLGHDGEFCSFDAFIKAFAISDPALDDLACIVRGADTGRAELTPQSHGLLAVSLGLSLNFTDDHEMLAQGIVLYDALYAWCRHARDERHNWKPAPVVTG